MFYGSVSKLESITIFFGYASQRVEISVENYEVACGPTVNCHLTQSQHIIVTSLERTYKIPNIVMEGKPGILLRLKFAYYARHEVGFIGTLRITFS